jgi:hypothetical protein
MRILILTVLFSTSAFAFNTKYADKDMPLNSFHRIGDYIDSNSNFLWLKQEENLSIQFFRNKNLNEGFIASINQDGFFIDQERKCKLVDNLNVKYGDGTEQNWYISPDVEAGKLDKMKKNFNKEKICDSKPFFNVWDNHKMYRYIAPAKMINYKKKLYETIINGKKAYFHYLGGRYLYSMKWRKTQFKECMTFIKSKLAQNAISKTLKCLESKSYQKCEIDGYSKASCDLEELYGRPRGEDFEMEMIELSTRKQIRSLMNQSVEYAIEIGNGVNSKIATCKVVKNNYVVTFINKDIPWYNWTINKKTKKARINFKNCSN